MVKNIIIKFGAVQLFKKYCSFFSPILCLFRLGVDRPADGADIKKLINDTIAVPDFYNIIGYCTGNVMQKCCLGIFSAFLNIIESFALSEYLYDSFVINTVNSAVSAFSDKLAALD